MLVPILPTITVAVMLMGLALMFELGLQVGRRRAGHSTSPRTSALPEHLPRV